MPKRPNPSPTTEKEEAKKARTVSSSTTPNDGSNVVGFINNVINVISTSIRPATSEISGVPPSSSSNIKTKKKSTVTYSSMNKTEPKNTKSSKEEGSLEVQGGNTFLKSLREMTSSASNGGSDEAKETDNTAQTETKTRTDTSNSKKGDKGLKSSTKEDDLTTLPVVPFPHLPLGPTSILQIWKTPLLILLGILNISALVYIASLQSYNSMIQMKYDLEMNKLHDELSFSQHEVNILRGRMKTLEEARDIMERIMSAGDTNTDDEGGMLTSKERKVWLEKLHLLESERQDVMDKFHNNLSEF